MGTRKRIWGFGSGVCVVGCGVWVVGCGAWGVGCRIDGPGVDQGYLAHMKQRTYGQFLMSVVSLLQCRGWTESLSWVHEKEI